MGVGFGSYSVILSGMNVAERGLSVTSHNISNENTQGFTRQRIESTSSSYVNLGKFQTGLGAYVQKINQLRNIFLDNTYRTENNILGYWSAKQKIVDEVEAIIEEPSDNGLQEIMNNFWNSWHELSKNPESLTVRAQVRQAGYFLVEKFKRIGEQFDLMESNLKKEICSTIDRINDITKQISKLNELIVICEGTGEKANDYRDQRNYLLDQLSEIMDITVSNESDGSVSVIAGGNYLISKGNVREIYPEYMQSGNMVIIKPFFENYDIEVKVKSGYLKGLMDAHVDVIHSYKDKLNKMVQAIAEEINNLCRSGKNLVGENGTDFFVPVDLALPFAMDNIQLNGNLYDLNNIVASKTDKNGDNEIAYQIAGIRSKAIINDSGEMTSIDDFYRKVIQDIGNEGIEANRMVESQQILVDQADSFRKSVGGVSLDEEMINMMKYQYSYNAAARTLRVLDEMLESVINRLGLVGR